MIDELCRIMIGKENRMLALARKTFTLEDLLNIKSRVIGTGFVGEKAGMLLARKILELDEFLPWENYLEHHDSFYVGSDIFYLYRPERALEAPHGAKDKRRLLWCSAPPERKNVEWHLPYEIKEQFQQLIEYLASHLSLSGQQPP